MCVCDVPVTSVRLCCFFAPSITIARAEEMLKREKNKARQKVVLALDKRVDVTILSNKKKGG